MATTLYRKYRPQRFADVVGQLHIRTTLEAEIESEKLAHAYLFVGPRGVGKTTVARILAKAVNCSGRKGTEPDNTCPSCTTMNDGRSLDLIEIDAASHTQVDHVRENILPAARTAPSVGKYKVFIIDEVHMLSISAFNALLKMLEEPPAHVIFILATTEAHRLPGTIISRCQRFDFRRITVADIVTRLSSIVREEEMHVEASVLDRIARIAGGSLRDAESVLGQILSLGEKKVNDDVADLVLPRTDVRGVLELLDAIIRGDTKAGLELVDRLLLEGVHLGQFMRVTIEVLRAILLVRFGIRMGSSLLSADDQERLSALASRSSPISIQRMLDVFMAREREERTATIPQLPLELAIVQLTVDASPEPPARSPEGRSENPQPEKKKRIQGETPSLSASAHHIAETWPKILESVGASNPSLASLLKTAEPRGILSGTLTIAFRYAFHRERLLDIRNRTIVERAAAVVLGERVMIDVVLDGTVKSERSGKNHTSAGENDAVWEQALQVFGGKTVRGSGEAPS